MDKFSQVVSNNQTRYLSQFVAEAVAEINRKSDPEWTYMVNKASDGMWYIAVFDEDGEHVGVM